MLVVLVGPTAPRGASISVDSSTNPDLRATFAYGCVSPGRVHVIGTVDLDTESLSTLRSKYPPYSRQPSTYIYIVNRGGNSIILDDFG